MSSLQTQIGARRNADEQLPTGEDGDSVEAFLDRVKHEMWFDGGTHYPCLLPTFSQGLILFFTPSSSPSVTTTSSESSQNECVVTHHQDIGFCTELAWMLAMTDVEQLLFSAGYREKVHILRDPMVVMEVIRHHQHHYSASISTTLTKYFSVTNNSTASIMKARARNLTGEDRHAIDDAPLAMFQHDGCYALPNLGTDTEYVNAAMCGHAAHVFEYLSEVRDWRKWKDEEREKEREGGEGEGKKRGATTTTTDVKKSDKDDIEGWSTRAVEISLPFDKLLELAYWGGKLGDLPFLTVLLQEFRSFFEDMESRGRFDREFSPKKKTSMSPSSSYSSASSSSFLLNKLISSALCGAADGAHFPVVQYCLSQLGTDKSWIVKKLDFLSDEKKLLGERDPITSIFKSMSSVKVFDAGANSLTLKNSTFCPLLCAIRGFSVPIFKSLLQSLDSIVNDDSDIQLVEERKKLKPMLHCELEMLLENSGVKYSESSTIADDEGQEKRKKRGGRFLQDIERKKTLYMPRRARKGEDILKIKGTLGKLNGVFFKNYEQRYFELHGAFLFYWKPGDVQDHPKCALVQNGPKPLGCIDLKCAVTVQDPANKRNFKIKGPLLKREFELQAESVEECEEWLFEIDNADFSSQANNTLVDTSEVKGAETFGKFFSDFSKNAKVMAIHTGLLAAVEAKKSPKEIAEICAKVGGGDLSLVDNQGANVLEFCINDPVVTPAIIEALMEKGLLIKNRNLKGQNLLHILCQGGNQGESMYAKLKLLLDNGVSYYAKDVDGLFPIHEYAKSEMIQPSIDDVKYISSSHDIYGKFPPTLNVKVQRGNTVLLYASGNPRFSDRQLMELIELGACVEDMGGSYRRDRAEETEEEMLQRIENCFGYDYLVEELSDDDTLTSNRPQNAKFLELCLEAGQELTQHFFFRHSELPTAEFEAHLQLVGKYNSLAAKKIPFDALTTILEKHPWSTIELLMKLGVDLNKCCQRDGGRVTARVMDFAARNLPLEKIKQLVAAGVPCNLLIEDPFHSRRHMGGIDSDQDEVHGTYPVDNCLIGKVRPSEVIHYFLDVGKVCTIQTLRRAIYEIQDPYVDIVEKICQMGAKSWKKPGGIGAYPDLLQLVVAYGGGMNVATETPAEFGANCGKIVDVLKVLLQYGANPNSIDDQGDSLLHGLCIRIKKIKAANVKAMFQLLLKNGADPRVANRKGQTILQFLREKGQQSLEDVLANYLEPEDLDAPASTTSQKNPSSSGANTYSSISDVPVELFIKTMQGKTITVKIALNAPLEQLADMVREKEGLEGVELRFIYAGKQLEEGRTLADYNIQKESTIVFVPRMRK